MRPPSTWHDSDTRVRMMTFVSDSPKTWKQVKVGLRLTEGNIYTHTLKLQEEGLLKQVGARPPLFSITKRGFSEMASYLNEVSFTLGTLRTALTYSSKL